MSDESDRGDITQGVFFLGQAQLGGDHLGQGIVAQVVQVQAIDEQICPNTGELLSMPFMS